MYYFYNVAIIKLCVSIALLSSFNLHYYEPYGCLRASSVSVPVVSDCVVSVVRD